MHSRYTFEDIFSHKGLCYLHSNGSLSKWRPGMPGYSPIVAKIRIKYKSKLSVVVGTINKLGSDALKGKTTYYKCPQCLCHSVRITKIIMSPLTGTAVCTAICINEQCEDEYLIST